MNRASRHFLAVFSLLAAGAHCSSSSSGSAQPSTGPDSGTPDATGDDATPAGDDATPAGDHVAPDAQADGPGLDDAGECEGTGGRDGAAAVPDEHRPAPTVCMRNPEIPATDASAASCATDVDCMADGSTSLAQHCVAQQCGVDECLVDADCGTGRLCQCSVDNGGGLRLAVNRCVTAKCRVDADCEAGGFCSPSRGYCGSVEGFYCHTSRDSCFRAATDCSCGGNTCVYTPTVGHFVCGTSTCAG